MTEVAFLAAVESALLGASLQPTPLSIGPVVPDDASLLPAIVTSLEESERIPTGLAEGEFEMTGALRVSTRVDLASPLLPGDDFSLLDPDRRRLALLHGDLVRRDGSLGTFASEDIQVGHRSNDDPPLTTSWTLAAGAPAAGQFRVDVASGALHFGSELPAGGVLEATYFIGRWDRTVERLRGRLSLEFLAEESEAVVGLSSEALRALVGNETPTSVGRLRLNPRTIGAVGLSQLPAGARHRLTVLDFEFERFVDRPLSSGGPIARVSIDTEAVVVATDRETGAVVEQIVTESE